MPHSGPITSAQTPTPASTNTGGTYSRAIRCPTLIVAAGKEPIGDGSAYRKMHERIAGSKLLQYDVASHNIGDQYADRCTDDLLRFLEQNT